MGQVCKSLAVLAAALFGLINVGSAQANGEVNVYSYRQPFLVKPLFDAFSRATDIKVNVVYAKKGLLERLKKEGRNSPADLVFTTDIGRLSETTVAGMTQPVASEVLQANVPRHLRSADDHWFGLTTRARIIVTAKDRVGEGEISRYEDLADPKWRGRICSRSGKHAYTVALTASMIAHAGEEKAKEWLAGFKANLARRPQGNDRAQVKAIHQGVCDIAVINNYYMGKMVNDEEQSDWAGAVNIVFPNQDDRGTHMNVSGMAMTKHAPNRDAAQRLMEFLSENIAQQMYAEQNFEYPVKSGVPWSGLLQSWGSFKTDDIDLETVAGLRGKASRLADEVNFDG